MIAVTALPLGDHYYRSRSIHLGRLLCNSLLLTRGFGQTDKGLRGIVHDLFGSA